jgi:hypothetical protein
MPSDYAFCDNFADDISTALVATGLGPELPLRAAVRGFVRHDVRHGTIRCLLGLCEIVLIKLKGAGPVSAAIAASRDQLRDAIQRFGEQELPPKNADEGEPIGQGPRTMAESLLALLVSNGIRAEGKLDQIEQAIRREFGRSSWFLFPEILERIVQELTEQGEPQSAGLITAAMRARDIFEAIAAPRPGDSA